MSIKKYFRTALAIAISTIAVSSCVNKDEWDTPPINCNNKFDAPNTTLAAFKALAPASGYVLITDDQIFDGYIKDKFYVEFILDDRNQVVDMWRKDLKLNCFQVNYGDF